MALQLQRVFSCVMFVPIICKLLQSELSGRVEVETGDGTGLCFTTEVMFVVLPAVVIPQTNATQHAKMLLIIVVWR